MRADHRFFLILLIFSFLGLSASAQSRSTASPPVSDVVRGAAAARGEYLKEFRNLISNETRTSTIYSKDGDAKKEHTVTSKFVVYGLTKDANRVTEFRNVTAVDGKPISNQEQRVENFFASLQKAESSASELERIESESQKYDKDIAINGFTLYQGVVLADNLLPFFEFKVAGQETINGTPVLVVDYNQTKPSPFIRADGSKAPADGTFVVFYDSGYNSGDPLNERLSGRMWIDATNFRIWREHRVMTIQPSGFDQPATVAETDFEYVPSDFGILTPRRIVHTQYRVQKKDRAARKDVSVALDYEKFRRPDVDVKVVETGDQ